LSTSTPSAKELSNQLLQYSSSWPQARQEALQKRLEWLSIARPNQIPDPEGDWEIYLALAGRGWGKTRTGAEDIAYFACFHDGARCAVVAPTRDDVRKTCFEGESGLMGVIPSSMIKGGDYNKSFLELELENKSVIQGFSADKPDRLRGPQFHRAWCDELAAWRYREAWDMLEFCVRLPEFGDPKILITTTPKPTKLVKDVVSMEGTQVVSGTTYDNTQNLAPAFLKRIKERYENTQLGQQELMGSLLTDVEGALWKRNLIQYVGPDELPDMQRVGIGIDPSVTANPDSDETGLIVAGRGIDGRYYVLDDLSDVLSVNAWPKRAVNALYKYEADFIVAEVNNGGDLVERSIKFEDYNVKVKSVRASRGKVVRAEPIAQLYEQGKVFHVGQLPTLEDQMCTFSPDTLDDSPDRVDALVWILTEIAENNKRGPRVRDARA